MSARSPLAVGPVSAAAIAVTTIILATVNLGRTVGAPADEPGPTPPEIIHLNGIARDFRRAHPDFNVVPAPGSGHFAGNIALTLGADGRPVFVGNGFQVASQWRDKDSRPIAPHLYASPSTIQLVSAPSLDAGATMDTWDSSLGWYGGDNVGPASFP